MNSSLTKLVNARCRVISLDPWYGVISARMTWVENESIGTMGVSFMRMGKVKCQWAPSFVDSLSIDSIIAVIKHEIEHIIRLHLVRGKHYKNSRLNAYMWNMACDWVINGSKESKRIANLPDGGCFIPTANNKYGWTDSQISTLVASSTAEEFMKWIVDNTESVDLKDAHGNNGFALFPRGSKKPITIELTDNHDAWRESIASDDEMRNTAKDLARAATQLSGSTPGHLVSDIEKLNKAEINFMNLFRNELGNAIGGKRATFSKRNRKNDSFGVKGHSNRNRIPLTILIDVSMSVHQKLLEQFFTEIESASQYFKIKIVTFDVEVTDVRDYHRGDWKKIKITGRGGTSFDNCLKYLEENMLVGRMNIMLTDGYDTIPEPRDYPFLWIVPNRDGYKYLMDQNVWGKVFMMEDKESLDI